ncbi:hypothetical protein ACPD1O_003670, partial [Vibrio cholerae]
VGVLVISDIVHLHKQQLRAMLSPSSDSFGGEILELDEQTFATYCLLLMTFMEMSLAKFIF